MITLTIPNDDTVALRQFGKALIEIASEKDGHPVDVTITPLVISTDVNAVESGINSEITDAYMQGCRDTEERLRAATETLQQAAPQMMNKLRFEGEELQGRRKEPEVDTTAQQVESLTTNVVHREVHFDNPAPQVSDATTDSTGTPWDERIHSASKALNSDGTWRLRRKPKDMDELEWSDYVSMIKADLQYPVECGGEKEETEQSFDAEQQPINLDHVSIDPAHERGDETAELTVEPPVTPPGDDYQTDAGVVTEQTVVGIPPLPVPPPVVVAPPVNIGIYQGGAGTIGSGSTGVEPTWDFPRLMTFLTERHGKIDVATVNTLLAQDGMLSVQELNAHPDKIGPFVARVKAHLGE